MPVAIYTLETVLSTAVYSQTLGLPGFQLPCPPANAYMHNYVITVINMFIDMIDISMSSAFQDTLFIYSYNVVENHIFMSFIYIFMSCVVNQI